jgi:hypothetical protein
VEAGDAGISATSSTAPGWGGGGASGWLPWIGVVVVVGLVGGGVGVSGLAGAATDEVVVVGHTSVLDAVVDAGSCPGGPVVRTLSADTRVLAVARSEDSVYLGVRNPDDVAATIWVPASVVVPDAGQDAAGLPVGEACPTGTLAPLIVVVVPVETTAEPSVPPSAQPSDTIKPTLGVPTATPTMIYNTENSAIAVTATDNVGVTGVKVTWTGPASSSGEATLIKGQWKLTFDPDNFLNGKYTLTLVARDAAGNLSAPRTVDVYHDTLD